MRRSSAFDVECRNAIRVLTDMVTVPETHGPQRELSRLTFATIGAAIEVHRVLGPGLRESLYEEALCAELTVRQIPFSRQVCVPVVYKQRCIGEMRLDLVVAGKLVLELKATDGLAPIHWAQVLSYLRATGFPLGLLINFNVPKLHHGIKRVIL